MEIRLPAQWEEQNFVQLVFPHKDTDWCEYLDEAIDTFVNIAKAIQKYQKVLIIAKNLNQIKSKFKNKKNLTFIRLDSDDTWSRDFGGISVFENKKAVILDFSFNAWGKKFAYKKDDKITGQLKLKGIFKDYKHKKIPFVLEGGSIDSNGEGIILTTSKCLLEKNRNPHLTKSTIEKKLKEFFGAKKILWLNNGGLIGDDTDSHIDTLARFVRPDTIVYQSCDDETDENYTELKLMEQELKSLRDLNNNPFKLIPFPWMGKKYFNNERLPATYVNFLIINKAVLVPQYGDKKDKVVMGIFKKIYPKRDILGIDCSVLIRQHCSLHCVTMEYN